MNTLAWILILAAVLMGRAVYKGRVLNMGEDLSDAFLALISSDTAKLKEVLDRVGDSNTAVGADLSIYQPAMDAIGGTAINVAKGMEQGLDEFVARANTSVALAAIILGSKAKGYRWGAAGPTYYDCSGLMWAAMRLAKAYTGARFTTDSFAKMTKDTYTRVSSPQVEDIVLWPFRVPYTTGHMGIVTGPDSFYSARSVRSGIGETKISTFRKDTPQYYRRTRFPSPDRGGK